MILKLKNNKGVYRCVSISNLFLFRNSVSRIVSQIPGVVMIKTPGWFDDVLLCEFKLNGIHFRLEEPWGNCSHYDLICDRANTPEMEQVVSQLVYSRKLAACIWILFGTCFSSLFVLLLSVVRF